jgi:predicted RNA-binding Zn-ribbon protein involved in translation (DUF1610 family)
VSGPAHLISLQHELFDESVLIATCPGCGATKDIGIDFVRQHAGRTLRCGKCEFRFTLPSDDLNE